jgi:hypothetical protein
MNVQSLVSSDHTKDWRTFAKNMFKLEDADPGYMLLARADMSESKKLRYVLGWCAFYNPGLAAKACDYTGAKFYEYLHSVYSTAQRASERRHFRGQAGLKALKQWQDMYPVPEKMIESCFGPTYMDVRLNMKHMAQMGDYFYWKLADIQDTVFQEPVDFTGCEKYMPKVPQQGAEIIAGLEDPLEDFNLVDTMRIVTQAISGMRHPFSDRGMLLQEAETVCCVFKQHYVGDYKYGFRTAKAVKRLRAMREQTKTADVLLEGVWAGGIWTPKLVDQVIERM